MMSRLVGSEYLLFIFTIAVLDISMKEVDYNHLLGTKDSTED
jgi:hypothetical protein